MLNKRMSDEEVGDLDFETYFNVTSNTMQPSQQREQQQQMMYNQNNTLHQQPIDTTQRQLDAPRYPSRQYYAPQNPEQPPYEILSWCLNQQQQPPSNTPSANLFSGGQTLPRPDYFYSAEQFNSARSTSEMAQQRQHRLIMTANEEQQSFGNNFITDSNAMNYRVPDQNSALSFPAAATSASCANDTGLITPISDNISPQFRSSLPSSESNSPCSITSSPTNVAPSIKSPPITKLLQIMEQCSENKDHANCSNKDYHETRNWRKTKRSDSVRNNHSNIIEAAVAAVTFSRKPTGTGTQFKKVAHNAIERRYRKNINGRILDLKNVVPALYKANIRENKGNRSSSGNEYEDSSDEEHRHDNQRGNTNEDGIVDGVEVAKKLNKATILHKATEYIHHLKHTNELAERENQVLLEILAQVPGGAEVLAEFQTQKFGHKQAEQNRLIAQRKESMDHEKVEHQRMLRERAAQRAVLAELVPKPERKPYPRRANKQNIVAKTVTTSNSMNGSQDFHEKQQQQQSVAIKVTDIDVYPSNNSANNAGNKAFMVLFLCLALVSPLSLENNTAHPLQNSQRLASSYQRQSKVHSILSNASIDYWHHIVIGLLTVLCILFGSLFFFKTFKHTIFVPKKV